MTDLTHLELFKKIIQHAKGKCNKIEKSECEAIKIDDKDGLLAKYRKKYNGSRVDYCDIAKNEVQLIELKDLKSKIEHLHRRYFGCKDADYIKSEICNDLSKKYTESKEIIQDIINSQSNKPTIQFTYKFMLVVKNNTDIVIMDTTLNELTQKIKLTICHTEKVCDKLISSQ